MLPATMSRPVVTITYLRDNGSTARRTLSEHKVEAFIEGLDLTTEILDMRFWVQKF